MEFIATAMAQHRFRRWTLQEEERLRTLAANAVSVSEIAAELKRSVWAIEDRLKSFERPKALPTGKYWTTEEDALLQSLMDKQEEAAEIAQKLNRTPQAIYARLQRLYRRRA